MEDSGSFGDRKNGRLNKTNEKNEDPKYRNGSSPMGFSTFLNFFPEAFGANHRAALKPPVAERSEVQLHGGGLGLDHRGGERDHQVCRQGGQGAVALRFAFGFCLFPFFLGFCWVSVFGWFV